MIDYNAAGLEPLPEWARNDTCHRIVVAVIGFRRVVVYEGYSPLQAQIMENWCIDQGYDYRVINTDFCFDNLDVFDDPEHYV